MIFGLPPFLVLLLLSIGITFVISLIYKKFLDHEAVREIKEKVKEKQQKVNEVQKTNPKEADQVLNEMLALNNKQLKLTMKPMFLILVFVSITFYFVRGMFPGILVVLPFTIPFFGKTMGWLSWYMITSIPFSQFFRTMMGVEL
jgi:uncharacterized membrane protein (DUF106 family)